MERSKKHILIVEDEMALSHALTIRLQQEGYAVTVASNGEEALQKVESHPFDLILLDIIMPRMDGLNQIAGHESQWSAKVTIHGNFHKVLSSFRDCRYRNAAGGCAVGCRYRLLADRFFRCRDHCPHSLRWTGEPARMIFFIALDRGAKSANGGLMTCFSELPEDVADVELGGNGDEERGKYGDREENLNERHSGTFAPMMEKRELHSKITQVRSPCTTSHTRQFSVPMGQMSSMVSPSSARGARIHSLPPCESMLISKPVRVAPDPSSLS